jgi:hypothetical protein
MPPSGVIIDGLTAIANENLPLAYAWHVFFGTLIVALIAGWRPAQRIAALLVVLPLASVSLVSVRGGNPFNAAVFGLVFITLVAISLTLPRARIQIARRWIAAGGAVFVVFGWMYPHFVRADSWLTFTYAAPLGLVPCPTLAAVLGLSAILQLYRLRLWNATVAITGVVYGMIGVFRLGVGLDYGLLAAVVFVLFLPRTSRAALNPVASFSAGPVPQ